MVAKKNIPTTITSEDNVIICARKMYAGFASHVSNTLPENTLSIIISQHMLINIKPAPYPYPLTHNGLAKISYFLYIMK
jgi:hypothetical protein